MRVCVKWRFAAAAAFAVANDVEFLTKEIVARFSEGDDEGEYEFFDCVLTLGEYLLSNCGELNE